MRPHGQQAPRQASRCVPPRTPSQSIELVNPQEVNLSAPNHQGPAALEFPSRLPAGVSHSTSVSVLSQIWRTAWQTSK